MLIVPSPSLLVSIKLWKDILLLKFSNSNRELMLPETFFVNVVLIHSLELETVAKVERIFFHAAHSLIQYNNNQ